MNYYDIYNYPWIIRFFSHAMIHPVKAIAFVALVILAAKVVWDLMILTYKAWRADLAVAPRSLAKGVILGKYGPFRLYSAAKKPGNICVIGAPGTGKTLANLCPTILSWPEEAGYFAIDIAGDIESVVSHKGDAYVKYAPLEPKPHPYNPFNTVDSQPTMELKDSALLNMADDIVPKEATQDVSVYYEEGARACLGAALLGLYYTDLDFGEICSKIQTTYEELRKIIHETGHPIAISKVEAYADTSEKEQASIMQQLRARTEVFALPRVRESLRRSNGKETAITPETIEKTNILFCIPEHEKETYAPVVELVVKQMLDYLSRRPLECKRQLLVAIDEFAAFPHLDITPALQTLRKRHVRIMIILQSIAQLVKNYGQATCDVMMDNFSINAIGELNDYNSAEYFSKKAGKHYRKRKTHGEKGQKTWTKELVPVFEPEEFGRLRRRQIVIARGQHFKIRKAFPAKKALKKGGKA